MYIKQGIGFLIVVGILFAYYIKKREQFELLGNVILKDIKDNDKDNGNTKDRKPLQQLGNVIAGDGQLLVFWQLNETTQHPIEYFIIQYYNPMNDSGIIHSKIVPIMKNKTEYSVIINDLDNDEQYLVQVVGVNERGMGQIEKGTTGIPRKSIHNVSTTFIE